MDSLTSMKTKLEKLRLYDFENGKYINAELVAYADEIDRIDTELAELQREYFIATAEDYGLSTRERFIGADRSSMTKEQRRAMLLGRENALSTGFTKEAFEGVLRSLGLKSFTLTEGFSDYRVIINVSDVLTESEKTVIRENAERIFPAHLDISFQFNS